MMELSRVDFATLMLVAFALGMVIMLLALKGKEMPRPSAVLFAIAATSWVAILLGQFFK